MTDEIEPPELSWTIVVDNLGLVYRIVNQHCHRSQDREDLVQEGLLGLFEAARRFDPSRQVAFSTVANVWITKYVLGFFQKQKERQIDDKVDFHADGSKDTTEWVQPDEATELESHEVRFIRQDLQVELKKHIAADLEDFERVIVALHWFADPPLTHEEIGAKIGMSKQAVSLVAAGAVVKLRRGLERRRRSE